MKKLIQPPEFQSEYFENAVYEFQGISKKDLAHIKLYMKLVDSLPNVTCIEMDISAGEFTRDKEPVRIEYETLKIYKNSVYHKVVEKHTDGHGWAEANITDLIWTTN